MLCCSILSRPPWVDRHGILLKSISISISTITTNLYCCADNYDWLKQRENDDFETILNELEDSIRTKEENLAFIKQRERRSIVLFTSYSILIWLLYVLAWWFGALNWGYSSNIGEHDDDEELLEDGDELLSKIAKTIPVGAFPVL